MSRHTATEQEDHTLQKEANKVNKRRYLKGMVAGSVACASLVLFEPVSASAETVVRFRVADALNTEVTGMNSNGTIVGFYSQNLGHPEQAFLRRRNGTIIVFQAPNASTTSAWDINSAGVIVGGSTDCCGGRAFVRSASGVFTMFDAPGALFTEALMINDAGIIIGSASYENGDYKYFIRAANGTFTWLDPDQGFGGINSLGEISGIFYDQIARRPRGFLRSKSGKMTAFDAPQRNPDFGVGGISAAGQIVGRFWDPSTQQDRGYIRNRDGTFRFFDLPGKYMSPYAISPNGIVSGSYCQPCNSANYVEHGFVRSTHNFIQSFDVLPPTGGPRGTVPIAINSAGEIAGITWEDPEYGAYTGFFRIP